MNVTIANLENVVSLINEATGMPPQPYNGCEPQAGCYHLSHAYGGVALHRMSLTPGCSSVSEPFYSGHVTRRELYELLRAFYQGIVTGKECVK